jgi:hypothetical protein
MGLLAEVVVTDDQCAPRCSLTLTTLVTAEAMSLEEAWRMSGDPKRRPRDL